MFQAVVTTTTRSGSEVSAPLWIGFVVVVLCVLVGGAILIYRDVQRRGGPALRAAILWLVFWPAGVFVWDPQWALREGGK